MATRGGRSRIEVEALSQKRGKDEIEKGKVGEGIVQIFRKKTSIYFHVECEILYMAVRYKLGCL